MRFFSVLIVAFSLVTNSAFSQTPTPPVGFDTVVDAFAGKALDEPVRVIVEVSPALPLIASLGEKNATNQAIEGFITQAAQLGAQNAERLGTTAKVVLMMTERQFRQLVQAQAPRAVWVDTPVPPTLNYALPVIQGKQAQSKGADGNGTVVVVLDTGVDNAHSFLRPRVIEEACFSSNVPANQVSSFCRGGATSDFGVGAGLPCSLSVQGCDHGTHVAGIAAGRDPNGTYIGAAPQAQIVAVKIFSLFPRAADCAPNPAPCPLTYQSDQIKALDWVRTSLAPRLPVAAVNMSIGGGSFTTCDNSPVAPSVVALRNLGIATVIAAGNSYFDNTVGQPGCITAAITVGASSNSDGVASFSNSGDVIDVMAPGVDITSAYPSNGTSTKSGTSMATPMVAGAIASMQSYFMQDVATLEAQLKQTGKSILTRNSQRRKPRIDMLASTSSIDTVKPATPYVIIRDAWVDTGKEPSVAGDLSSSPFIWARNQGDCSSSLYTGQNPQTGRINYGCVMVENGGKTQGAGTLQLFWSGASMDNAAAWTLIGSQQMTVPASHKAVVQMAWGNVPKPGHYCLLARWVPTGGDLNLQLPGGLANAVRASNKLAWHNVNVIQATSPVVGSALEVYPEDGGTYTLAVDITNVDPSAVDLGMLAMELGTDPGDLRLEPTSALYRFDGRTVLIPLRNGVYYIPDIKRPQPAQAGGTTQNKLEFRFSNRDRSSANPALRMKVEVSRIDDIASHKSGRSANASSVTYNIEY